MTRRVLAAGLAAGAVVLVIVSNPRTTRSACRGGQARVETLSDLDRRDVGFIPVPSSVERLRRLHEPSGDTVGRRAAPVETTTFRIRARLIAMKREPNHDIDLFVSASKARSGTMVVTFPGGTCSARTRKMKRDEMRRAESALIAACGEPTRNMVSLTGAAEISGVGLFGRRTRSGDAPNGIGLAPVLHFKSSGCRRRR